MTMLRRRRTEGDTPLTRSVQVWYTVLQPVAMSGTCAFCGTDVACALPLLVDSQLVAPSETPGWPSVAAVGGVRVEWQIWTTRHLDARPQHGPPARRWPSLRVSPG